MESFVDPPFPRSFPDTRATQRATPYRTRLGNEIKKREGKDKSKKKKTKEWASSDSSLSVESGNYSHEEEESSVEPKDTSVEELRQPSSAAEHGLKLSGLTFRF